MPQDVYEAVKQFLENLITDDGFAVQYAGDPNGFVAAQGLTEHDLSGVDIQQLVGQVCGELNLPPDVQNTLQQYASGNPPAAAGLNVPPASAAAAQHQSVEQVMQHLNYVTYVTHETNQEITQNIIDNSIDNSTNVSIDGEVHGNIDIDPDNVTATNGGVANQGDGPVTAATGDESNAVGGNNSGNINSGDGAVVGSTAQGPINTGSNDGGVIGGNINGPVNTGTFGDGVQANGPVSDTVVGDHNDTANIDGNADGTVIQFGEGSTATNVNHSTLEDSAVSGSGDATTISDVTQGQGAGIATGEGHVTTRVEDNDTYEYPEPKEIEVKQLEEPADAPDDADDPADALA